MDGSSPSAFRPARELPAQTTDAGPSSCASRITAVVHTLFEGELRFVVLGFVDPLPADVGYGAIRPSLRFDRRAGVVVGTFAVLFYCSDFSIKHAGASLGLVLGDRHRGGGTMRFVVVENVRAQYRRGLLTPLAAAHQADEGKCPDRSCDSRARLCAVFLRLPGWRY